MRTKNIFYRILYFPLVRIVLGAVVVMLAYNFFLSYRGGVFKTDLFSLPWRNVVNTGLSVVLALLLYKVFFQFYEKRKITELLLNRFFRSSILGIVLGSILMALTILIMYLNGGYEIISWSASKNILDPMIIALAAATMEEILFRGILFRILEEKLGSYISVAISAVIFGLMHLSNPDSTLINSLNIALQAGILLSLSFMLSRNLWFPIAVHFAWNFTQSGVFGARVSGIDIGESIINAKIEGSLWLTGGSFGPEGSIQALILCLIASLALFYYCKKYNRIIKPFWRRNKSNRED